MNHQQPLIASLTEEKKHFTAAQNIEDISQNLLCHLETEHGFLNISLASTQSLAEEINTLFLETARKLYQNQMLMMPNTIESDYYVVVKHS